MIVQYEVQTAQAETNPSSISVDGHHLLLDTVYVSSSLLLEVEAVEEIPCLRLFRLSKIFVMCSIDVSC